MTQAEFGVESLSDKLTDEEIAACAALMQALAVLAGKDLSDVTAKLEERRDNLNHNITGIIKELKKEHK